MKTILAFLAIIVTGATVAQAHAKIETTALSAAVLVQTNTTTGQIRVCVFEPSADNPFDIAAGKYVCGEWYDG